MAIQADPSYAPAWARLGRCLRLLGKYGDERGNAAANLAAAEEAFQRAFALNSDLPLAHNLYTYAEVDSGRAVQAVTRLLVDTIADAARSTRVSIVAPAFQS